MTRTIKCQTCNLEVFTTSNRQKFCAPCGIPAVLNRRAKRDTKSVQPIARKEYRANRFKLGLCVDCPKKSIHRRVHCQNCRDKNTEIQRRHKIERPWVKTNNYRLKNYCVSPEQYIDLFFDQFGRCGICENYFLKTPHLDHDHETGHWRGLLCSRCNTGLWFLEDKKLKHQAELYIQRRKQNG